MAADQRILGGRDFVQGVLSEAQERAKETLRLSSRVPDLTSLPKRVSEIEGVDEAALRSGSWLKRVVRAWEALCQLAVWKMGYPGAEVARFLDVTTSAVNRAALTPLNHPQHMVVHDRPSSGISVDSPRPQFYNSDSSARLRPTHQFILSRSVLLRTLQVSLTPRPQLSFHFRTVGTNLVPSLTGVGI